MSTTLSSLSNPPNYFRRSLLAGLIGGAIAAVINVIIFFTAQALNGGGLMLQEGQELVRLPVAVVFWFSLSAGLTAGFIYAFLANFISKPKPVFLGISALVLIAFFFGPITSATGLIMILSLELMHFAAAVPILFSIFWATNPRNTTTL